MIFTYHLFDEIVAERKTVTRRPVVTGGNGKAWRRVNPPAVGDLLPLQRGYAKATAWARVTSVDREEDFAGWVTDAEAHREGTKHAADFRALWTGIYGEEPQPVYRIAFELEPARAHDLAEASQPATDLAPKSNPEEPTP